MPTAAVTEADDDNDSEWDEDDESSEADDDGRIYKNPRNLPSTECPRDEEQATLLVSYISIPIRLSLFNLSHVVFYALS